jgi:hypothetical protein
MRMEEPLDLGAKSLVAGTGLVEIASTLSSRLRQRAVKHLFDTRPPVAIHGAVDPSSA